MSATPSWKKSFAITCIVGALVLVALWPRNQAAGDLIEVRFLGYTNWANMARPFALFDVTSFHRDTLWVDHLAEVKTGGNWSNYMMTWSSSEKVAPHQTRRLEILVPEYGSAWRVRVAYAVPSTPWERRRFAWAQFLRERNMSWAARIVEPRKRDGEVTTPVVKSIIALAQ